MLSREVLRKIRYVELKTRQLVNESFAGAYHSVFKGKGIEFDAVRPYEPGDDIRAIDWNVSARTGEVFVKRYVEERELTVFLLVDISASSFFGTQKQQKRDVATELGAILAYSAIRNNDRVGLILFSDQIELYVPPGKGHNHILRLIRGLVGVEPSHPATDLAFALQTVYRLLKRRSVIFFISDFFMPLDSYLTDLKLLARRHDVIAVALSDPLEQRFSPIGLVGLKDAETGSEYWIDTWQKGWQNRYREQVAHFREMRNTTFAEARVETIHLSSEKDCASALISFFQSRSRQIRK